MPVIGILTALGVAQQAEKSQEIQRELNDKGLSRRAFLDRSGSERLRCWASGTLTRVSSRTHR
jgi:hypothetical protein